MSFSDFSVDRPVTISMLVLIVMVIGAMSLSKLGLDMMPDVDFPTLSVMTRYDGASSADIEKQLTRTVEGALAAVSGVTHTKSYSQEDASIVNVEFEWGTDLDAAAQDLRDALGLIKPILPDGADDPMVVKFSLSAMPILGYSVAGMSNTVALKRYLEDNLRARMERIDGVAQVLLMGGDVAEIKVDVDRQALEASGVTLDTVLNALRAQNMDLPGGRVIEGRTEFLVRTLGEFQDLESIRQSLVSISPSGTPVRVRDVARVTLGVEDVRNMVRGQGQPAIFMMIAKQSGANPLRVAQKVKAQLAELQETLPPDMSFNLLMDTGDQIELMARNVSRSGLIGGLFAIFFMFIFLRSVRPTLAIAVAVPLSLLATFIPIYATGETLNMMTMGGLMLGIGMLVDNAVVVIENVFRHLQEGMSRKEAARNGAREVGMAITASTATTVAVFLPLFFGGGLAGELVRGLAMVVAFSLAASLLVALTIVPMLASVLFNEEEATRLAQEGHRWAAFRARYERALLWALNHRKTTVASAILIFALAMGTVPMLGAEFMPGADQPLIMGMVKFPVGTPVQETSRAVARVEAFTMTLPDIESTNTGIGVEDDDLGAGLSETNPSGPHEAQIILRLANGRTRDQTEIIAELRAGVPEIEGMTLEWMDMGQAMMGGSAKPVQINVFGPDLVMLGEVAQAVIDGIRDVPGLKDLASSVHDAKPERHLIVDRERASSYGLTVVEVARALEMASLGGIAGIYRVDNDELMIRVRYEEKDRMGFDDLDRVTIPTRMGFSVPLRQVAHFETGSGAARITRDDQQRYVTVKGSLEGRDLGSVIADVETALGPVKLNLPAGYRLETGGTYEDMIDAFITLLGALALAILLVYMVMAAQFETFVHPVVIMVSVPLSLVGVVMANLMTGTPISVATFVGLIMLAGIVVNNGIVLIDAVNQYRREGMPKREAIIQGGGVRLRAVLITSGTTITALLPMAIWPGRGAEMSGLMGMTVAGGLAASSVLTLIIVPVVYEWFDDIGARNAARIERLVHGAAPKQESAGLAPAAMEADELSAEGSPA